MNILSLHISRGSLLDSEGVEWWVFGHHHGGDEEYMDIVSAR